jgi:His/Glu/Gln/Arg/opine family amino acid ABC transporter permease subunit
MTRGWLVFTRPDTWTFLAGGLLITVTIAAVTVALSFVLGTLLAFATMSRRRPLSGPARAYVRIMRGIPVFLIILMTYFGLGRVNVHVSVAGAVTIALTIYTTAYISEIVRAGVLSIAHGQMDAARSLGLTGVQAFRYVILPQAFRMMVPPLVNQYIVAITGTSIGAVVGLDELLRRSIILYNGYQNPTEMLIVTGSIYFLMFTALASFSKRFELGSRGARSERPTEAWWDQLIPGRAIRPILTK